jgi:hypothetical protein
MFYRVCVENVTMGQVEPPLSGPHLRSWPFASFRGDSVAFGAKRTPNELRLEIRITSTHPRQIVCLVTSASDCAAGGEIIFWIGS